MMDGWCELQETVCQLAKAIAVPAATIYLFPFLCRVRRTVNQISSMIKRQIVISAGRKGVSGPVGLRVLCTCKSAATGVGLCYFFGSSSLEESLGVVQKGPAVSKRSSDLLCVFYIGHVSHTVL
jgi:hypothetical protein